MEADLQQRREDFEREAIPHMDALYNFAMHLTQKSEDAQDLLQETYLKAFRFFDSFKRGTNCKAWLFQILKNSFINRYRKLTREPTKVSYNDVEEFYETIRSDDVSLNDLERDLFDNVLDDEMTAAMASLPPNFRAVLILNDLENFTYEEIAGILDIPIGTVRSRLHRARRAMREQLMEYARKRGIVPGK